ncbi:DUF2637 domain-containing protein [Cellulomonas sp. Y8]|uniref:DUF2637 domain-containing protein n=1 Tax=Cellulomonas sp. Y8 TaxID=2591145 RepID=UPI003D740D3C
MSSETTDQTRPAARLQPDSRPVVLTATWLVALLAIAAFVMGARGLAQVGAWAGLAGWQVWLVPIVLDIGLGVAALAAVVARARQEPARLARVLLVALTSLSVTGQVAHVLLPAEHVTTQLVVGAVIAAAAPLTVLASTEVLLSLAIAPPVRRKTSKTTRATAAATAKTSPERVAAPPTRQASTPAAKSTPPAPRPGDDTILALKAEGLSNQAVADQLDIGKGSVQRAVERQRATEATARPALVDAAA